VKGGNATRSSGGTIIKKKQWEGRARKVFSTKGKKKVSKGAKER